MRAPTPEQAASLELALQALIEAVKAGGEMGAPAGAMYAALIGSMSLRQFEGCMRALVRNGNLRQEGDLYFFVRDLVPA